MSPLNPPNHIKPKKTNLSSLDCLVSAPVRIAVILAAALLAARGARADTISSADSFLPAVHVTGASGVYRTDVTIFNPDPAATAVVDLLYGEADRDGTTRPVFRIPGNLAPLASVTLVDVVSSTFGRDASYGLLEVKATESTPVLVTSNTYNVAGALAGTYGQYSPGQPSRNSVGFENTTLGDLHVTGLPNDSNHRTNAVVMNPTSLPLEAGVRLWDAAGSPYKVVLVSVPPFSLHQLNDIFNGDFASAAPPAGGPWRLSVFVNTSNGARALAYATVTDLRTGDPYLLTGQQGRP